MLNRCLVVAALGAVAVLGVVGVSGCAAPTQGSAAPAGAGSGGAVTDSSDGSATTGQPLSLPPLQCTLAAAAVEPAWLRDAVGYQIWVRSFRDSDGDGHGDLDGVIAGLDALRDGKPGGLDLDVDTIWLSPIFVSPSDHGYDATDYLHVQPQFGGDAALQRLFAAAKARGIRVLLDLVLNHTSREHPWFLDSKSGAGAEHRNWYVWRDVAPPAEQGWGQPWNAKAKVWHDGGTGAYYGLFWEGMPDLNLAWPPVADAMIDVAKHWLGQGASGFRLDAVRYLVESGPGAGQADTVQTHAFLRRLMQESRAVRGEVALIGEVWTDTATVRTYLEGDDPLSGAFDFDTAQGLRKGLELRSAALVRNALCKGASVPGGALQHFAGNHDMPRIAGFAGSDALRVVALALPLLLPGTPWIYQGDELGLPDGDAIGDHAYRTPLPWQAGAPAAGFTTGTPWQALPASYPPLAVDAQDADPKSVRSRVRELVALRRSLPALHQGPARVLAAEGDASHAALMWVSGAKAEVLVVLAIGAAEVALPQEFGGASLHFSTGAAREGNTVQGPGVFVLER